MKISFVKNKRPLKIPLILFFITLMIATISNISVNFNLMSRKNYNDSIDRTISEVISDSVVIPDKFNTGFKGKLEVVPEETFTSNTDGAITFIWRGSSYSVNIATIKSEVVIVENKEFTNSISFLNEGGSNKKIIFRNCKFTSISTGRLGLDDWEVIFENCSFKHAFGSNLTFHNCYFGGSISDGLNPFQNVNVYDSFFSDFAKSSTVESDNKYHSDATQMYGYSGNYKGEEMVLDVQNIYFYNCRMEVPNLLFTSSEGYVNAALMIQPEYSDLHDVKFEKCIVNGGGFSIYISSKNNSDVRDLTLEDIKVGDSAWYGELYKGSLSIPESEFAERNIIYNTSKTNKLYVGSVWSEDDGVHISVTNDTAQERTLVVELANGEKKEFNIRASLPGSTWWNNTTKYVEESRDRYTYEDFPFDIELVVENTSFVKCYDGETLIRTQRLSNQIIEDIKVTGVTLDKSSVTLKEDETIQLTASVLPANATNKNVVWSSSDSNVATINQSGLVKAKKEGTAIITVTTEDGSKTATFNIEVKKKEIKVTLTYDANGGKNAPSSETIDKENNATIKNKEEMTKDGYEFLGWSTDKNSQTADLTYQPGNTLKITSNVTLYAVWKEENLVKQYIVKWYDEKTNEEIKASEQRKGTIGNIVSVTELDKTIAGYTFNKENINNILSANLEESDTVLKLYFKKNIDNIEENIVNEKNPITKDSILIAITILTISFVSLILLLIKKQKLKKS